MYMLNAFDFWASEDFYIARWFFNPDKRWVEGRCWGLPALCDQQCLLFQKFQDLDGLLEFAYTLGHSW